MGKDRPRQSDSGVVAVDGSWISSSYILRRTPMGAEFSDARRFSVLDNPEDHSTLFRHSATTLQQFLRQELPHCRVILNPARWVDYFIDEQGAIQSVSSWEQNDHFRTDPRVTPLERVFSDRVKCDLLCIDEEPIFADVQHKWGRPPDQYVEYFYTTFTEKLFVLVNLPLSSSSFRTQSMPMRCSDPDVLTFRETYGMNVSFFSRST